MLVILIIWLAPIVLISRSKKVGHAEKLAWILGALFISWVVFILFYLLAPLKPNDK